MDAKFSSQASGAVADTLAVTSGSSVVIAAREGAFNALFSALGEYNQQFSIAARLGRTLQEAINPQPAGESLPAEEVARATVESLNADHAATLRECGLLVGSAPGDFPSVRSQGKRDMGSSRAILLIDNPRALSEFLNSMPAPVSAESEFSRNLASLPGLLVSQVRAVSDLADPQDRTLTLLSSLRAVVTSFERIGLGEACAGLKIYAERVKDKNLAEYLDAERQGLLMPPGTGLFPGDLQGDSYPPTVQNRWEQALAVLERLASKDSSKALHDQIARNLEAVVAAARENLGQVSSIDRRRELKPILSGVHSKLLPSCTSVHSIRAEDAESLQAPLAALQRRSAPPHLVGYRDLYLNEVRQENRVALNIRHDRDGRLLAHVCAAPSRVSGEADIVSFAVDSSMTGLGLEERTLGEIESTLRKMDYQAVTITLEESDSALGLLEKHYGRRAQRVGTFADSQVVVRIDLGAGQ